MPPTLILLLLLLEPKHINHNHSYCNSKTQKLLQHPFTPKDVLKTNRYISHCR